MQRGHWVCRQQVAAVLCLMVLETFILRPHGATQVWPCGLVLGTDRGNTVLELCDKLVVSCVHEFTSLGVRVKCPHPCMLPRQGTHCCIWLAVVGGKPVDMLGCELEYAQGAHGASAGVELAVCIEQVRCNFKFVLHMDFFACCVSSVQQM
jgi:hypothetical protein